ncbi:MAG: orotate phosphoribosyltransferase [Oscillospiraceae bacterium]|jgi:orotate phosphoribosyltransferase|nr:orotate phosphoribosyltransferase [Oscillospiraceae bacterium]
MDEKAVLDILDRTRARLEGHFRYTSGRHGAVYIQGAQVFQHAEMAEKLCRALAGKFSGVDAVIGPAVGAILMSYEVSRHLGCRNLFVERENGVFKLRRNFSITPGERILMVEDVVTTGGSVKEAMAVCREHGAEIIGVGALVDRTGGANPFDVLFEALVRLDIPSWTEEECPLCKEGIPCVKPGSRPAV